MEEMIFSYWAIPVACAIAIAVIVKLPPRGTRRWIIVALLSLWFGYFVVLKVNAPEQDTLEYDVLSAGSAVDIYSNGHYELTREGTLSYYHSGFFDEEDVVIQVGEGEFDQVRRRLELAERWARQPENHKGRAWCRSSYVSRNWVSWTTIEGEEFSIGSRTACQTFWETVFNLPDLIVQSGQTPMGVENSMGRAQSHMHSLIHKGS